MSYVAAAVVALILAGYIAFLDEKRKHMGREINSLYETLSRQNDRLSVMQTAIAAAEHQIRDMSGEIKSANKQEKMLFEGVNNILNYDINQARKAVRDRAEDDE